MNETDKRIVELMAQGYNSRKIGQIMNLGKLTIDTYRYRLLTKTGCKNAAHLMSHCYKNKILEA